MSDRPVTTALSMLRRSQDEPDDEAARIRDEVRVMATLLIAEELSIIADAVTRASAGIDTALRVLTEHGSTNGGPPDAD